MLQLDPSEYQIYNLTGWVLTTELEHLVNHVTHIAREPGLDITYSLHGTNSDGSQTRIVVQVSGNDLEVLQGLKLLEPLLANDSIPEPEASEA